MKKILFSAITALSLFIGAAAHAGPSHIDVLKVEQSGDLMPPIPAGVNPITTKITIRYSSCAFFGQKSFEAVLAAEGGDEVPTMIVRTAPNQMDCMGPSFIRTLTLVRKEFGMLDKVLAPQNGKLVELEVEHHFVY